MATRITTIPYFTTSTQTDQSCKNEWGELKVPSTLGSIKPLSFLNPTTDNLAKTNKDEYLIWITIRGDSLYPEGILFSPILRSLCLNLSGDYFALINSGYAHAESI